MVKQRRGRSGCGVGWILAIVVWCPWGVTARGDVAAPEKPSPGQELYARHCAACHGVVGDGKGVGAVFLFPKPRNFRAGKFRLISTDNNVPTRDDLQDVVERGMPGSSMPPWKHLDVAQRRLLVDEVVRLTRVGARERYIETLRKEEGATDEELKAPETQAEIEAYATRQVTPGELTTVPKITAADPASVARGKEIYVKQSCHSCHGLEGKGDGVQKMIDDDGFATRPRDLTRGIYKGGFDPASLYRRIYTGMPGTPMPTSKNLTPGQVVDMVHFLRSLSTEAQREAVVLKRQVVRAKRIAKVPDDIGAAVWQTVPAVEVPTFPLWWRDDADSDLRLQAAHDGQTLALRMSWKDSSHNARAYFPEEFEDMAAVQLFQGKAEPFLGMGDAGALLDVWLWRPGVTEGSAAESQLDDYPFDTPQYRERAQGKPLPDFITARAGGNPLATRTDSAGNLAVKGIGSTTYRPRPSQIVKAAAQWNNGRWTVVLRRPLAAPADSGLSLAAGSRCSAAFALWDGAARDRGGQKMISIWHDLQLE